MAEKVRVPANLGSDDQILAAELSKVSGIVVAGVQEQRVGLRLGKPPDHVHGGKTVQIYYKNPSEMQLPVAAVSSTR